MSVIACPECGSRRLRSEKRRAIDYGVTWGKRSLKIKTYICRCGLEFNRLTHRFAYDPKEAERL